MVSQLEMILGIPQRNKLRTYYCLTRWKVWRDNIDHLEEQHDKKRAITFFTALKQLEKEEVAFLADKYMTSNACNFNQYYAGANTYKPRTDEQMACKLGIEFSIYKRKRQKIEKKLERLMNDEDV